MYIIYIYTSEYNYIHIQLSQFSLFQRIPHESPVSRKVYHVIKCTRTRCNFAKKV